MPSAPTGSQPRRSDSAPAAPRPRRAGALLPRAALRGPPRGRGSSGSKEHRSGGDRGHSHPSTTVRQRCLAVSAPLGVRVGLSAALRGPSQPAAVPQGTPENRRNAGQRRFSAPLACAVRHTGVRLDRNRRAPRARSSVAIPSRLPLPAPGPRSRQHGNINTVAPAIAAFEPSTAGRAPPFGRQRAARRQSRPLSGPLRPFPSRGGTPGHPRKSEKCPSMPFSAPLTSRNPAHHGVAYTSEDSRYSFLSQGGCARHRQQAPWSTPATRRYSSQLPLSAPSD